MACNCGSYNMNGLGSLGGLFDYEKEKGQILAKYGSARAKMEQVAGFMAKYRDQLRQDVNWAWWADNFETWRTQFETNITSVIAKNIYEQFGWSAWAKDAENAFNTMTKLSDALRAIQKNQKPKPPPTPKPPPPPSAEELAKKDPPPGQVMPSSLPEWALPAAAGVVFLLLATWALSSKE